MALVTQAHDILKVPGHENSDQMAMAALSATDPEQAFMLLAAAIQGTLVSGFSD